MKVHVIAKKILDDKRGTLFRGQVVDLPDAKADFFRKRGEVELYETKVLRDRPYLAVGDLSSASRAALPLPQTISISYTVGDSLPEPKKSDAE
jgi:hypothetical protein